MSTTPSRIRRCALYTRKSSEEGLEQSFNSLDAQREACGSYVKSQKAEGWRVIARSYNDGGYSGGNMERPGVQQLLADIAQGLIDVVVVYKIDRLTRSLADFARIVELFERHHVSFVSVTQAFNTTSSMGRLTLNVLLSFAQFEREVTGERIRDKIAASKAKGLWMGGSVPLGYDKAPDGARTLVINPQEARLVQHIFQLYLELGSVHSLVRQLQAEGATTKRTRLKNGQIRGAIAFGRGPLFHLLRNRLYLGEIIHRSVSFPGLHPPLIDRALFDDVQTRLDAQKKRAGQAKAPIMRAPLTGRIFDAENLPMSPTHSRGKGGRLYRYYVSAPLQQGKARRKHDQHPRRIAAAVLEEHLVTRLMALLPDPSDDPAATILALIQHVIVKADYLVITLHETSRARIDRVLEPGDLMMPVGEKQSEFSVRLRFSLATCRGRTEIKPGHRALSTPDKSLVKALRKAHALLTHDRSGFPTLDAAPAHPYHHKLIRLAFLSPRIQRAILTGTQPRDLKLTSLMEGDMPLLWSEQERRIGLAENCP